jgi:YfiH family protein
MSILRSANLADRPGLKHGFTTQPLGADYDHLAVKLKILVSQIYYVEQIHSAKVVVIDEESELGRLPQADALVTTRRNVIVGVRTADCLPVLLHDPVKSVIAAVHAGFRGLLGGILQNSVDMMVKAFGCQSENIDAVFGPCIRAKRYEVGEEVLTAFRDQYGKDFSFEQLPGQKPHLDLAGSAQKILAKMGIGPAHDAGLCTYEDARFSSYRRAPGAGRQFNFIGLFAEP